MKRSIIGLSVLCMLAGMAHAEGMNLGFQIGQKGLDNDDWGKIDSQLAVGLHFDKDMGWPVNLAADLLSTAGSDGDLEGGTMEIGLGVRKYFPMGEKIQLYGQVGLAFISANAKVDGTSFDESGSGIGFALNGGALYPVTDMFKVGVDLRLSSGNADFGDPVGEVAAGGFTFGLVVAMGL